MKFVPEVVGRTIGRNTLMVQKASPEVLLAAGIVGLVGSTVLACRATLKVDEVLEEAKNKLETVRTTEHPDYSEKDRSRDVSLVYFQTGVKTVRLYAPAIILGGISIYALTTSHSILTKRNVALTAAYSALEKGFSDYRSRVVEKYGEEEDRDFRYGAEKVQIVDEKTGKKKTVTRVSPDDPSIYARFFDPYSTSWSKEPEYNLLFLKCQQNYANDLLRSRGHVFLNEVYDMLGVPRSKAGAVVGWLLSSEGETDNFIDFGVFDGTSDRARDFVNGLEGAILLDFNVDGVIYDKIGKLGDETMAIDVAVEEVADNLEELAEATRSINTQAVGYFIAGVCVGACVGFYYGYRFNREKIKAEAFKQSEEELQKIREVYQQKAVAAQPKPAVEEIVKEQGYVNAEPSEMQRPLPAPVPVQDIVDRTSPPAMVAYGVSSGSETVNAALGVWNYPAEVAQRTKEQPYVIHEDEFRNSELGYTHVSYQYWAEDDVLTDEDERPLPHSDIVVGRDNLKWGHGSEDPDIVFVRNDRLELDMEICRSYMSYERDVLGHDNNEEN